MRRTYRWRRIAGSARKAPGVWRLDPDLIGVTPHLEAHAKRRVRELWPDDGGRFEFTRTHSGRNDLGIPTFDLLVRYVTTEGES